MPVAFVRRARVTRVAASGFCLVLSGAQLAWAQEEPAPPPQPKEAAASQVQPAAQGQPSAPTEPAKPPQELPTPPEAASKEPAAVEPPADKLKLDIGGGFILDYYLPFKKGATDNFDLFELRLRLDASFGRFRVHMTPRIGDEPTRDWHPGSTWVEEMYAATDFGPVTIKAGKVYSHLGLMWDNSWWGNAQEFDGLKLDPNLGVSVEGNLNQGQPFGLGFSAQYFVVDGTTNYALAGRDTQTIPGAHRRHQFFGRVEPHLRLNEAMNMGLQVGLGASNFRADLPATDGRAATKDRVTRMAADVLFTAGKTGRATMRYPAQLAVWAEYSQQWGRHVLNYPVSPVAADPATGTAGSPGKSSDKIQYWMLGGEYTLDALGADWFTLRFNYNSGDYKEVDYVERRFVPGFSVALHPNLVVQVEYAYIQGKWGPKRPVPAGTPPAGAQSVELDNALFLVLHSNF